MQPQTGSDNQKACGKTQQSRQSRIGLEESPAPENFGPVVLSAADERQDLRAGIRHVAGDIEQVFTQPHQRRGETCGLSATLEVPRNRRRESQLKKRAAVHRQTFAEKTQQRMPRLVKGKIGAIENRHPGLTAKVVTSQTDYGECDNGKQRCARHCAPSGSIARESDFTFHLSGLRWTNADDATMGPSFAGMRSRKGTPIRRPT